MTKTTNNSTKIMNALLMGPRTRDELASVGGKSWYTRIYEMNKMFSDIKIVNSGDLFYIKYVGKIRVDHKRVYPKQRVAA